MPASNLFATVKDPDDLIAGTSPYATFAAAFIQVYRYTTEALARADTNGSGGTLLDAGSGYTWTLIASTAAVTEEAGPWRFGYYDSGQGAASWYRLRYANAALNTFSLLSEPWEGDRRPAWALRDILWEMGRLFGGAVKRGVALTNATVGLVDCDALWKSTLLDDLLYQGWHLLVTYDAGGAAAAPEGEEARLNSIAVATGIATLDRDLSAAVTAGDIFLISAYFDWTEAIGVLNRAREQMQLISTVDVALHPDVDRYPLPWGIKHESDVLEGFGVIQYSNTDREDEYPIDYRVEFDGLTGWLYVSEGQGSNLVRLRVVRNYRDLEGNMSAMADTTNAPIEWLRPVFALEMARYLAKGDPEEPVFQQLVANLTEDAQTATGKYAPEIRRKAKQGQGRRLLPGPAAVY